MAYICWLTVIRLLCIVVNRSSFFFFLCLNNKNMCGLISCRMKRNNTQKYAFFNQLNIFIFDRASNGMQSMPNFCRRKVKHWSLFFFLSFFNMKNKKTNNKFKMNFFYTRVVNIPLTTTPAAITTATVAAINILWQRTRCM